VRSYAKCKIVTATENDETLTCATKKPIATLVANSNFFQWHHCLPHQYPRRMMPEPCLRNGEIIYEMENSNGNRKRQNTYLCHNKTNCGTSCQLYANPMASLQSLLNYASIDAYAAEENRLEGIRMYNK
jgi:hypothetical protein